MSIRIAAFVASFAGSTLGLLYCAASAAGL